MLRSNLRAALAALLVFVMAVPAAAGVRATLILTSGERVRGMLVDMGGSDFTMSEGGNETRIPINDVAVIDFVGGGQGIPATETSKMQSGRHLIFQRGGDYYYGRLVDLRGDNPLRLIFNTNDGEREMGSNEIGRIYLRRWEGMPAADSGGGSSSQPSRPADPPPGGFSVPATRVWVDTGIQVRSGQMVAFNAKGEVFVGEGDDKAGSAGAYSGRVAGPRAEIPGLPVGALIGKVANTRPFAIGNQTQALRMPATGVLFLGVNDDQHGDNRGEFRVDIFVR
jgi:hypothetical protein